MIYFPRLPELICLFFDFSVKVYGDPGVYIKLYFYFWNVLNDELYSFLGFGVIVGDSCALLSGTDCQTIQ